MKDYRPEKETIIITKTPTEKLRVKSLKSIRRNIKVPSIKVKDLGYQVNKLKPSQSSQQFELFDLPTPTMREKKIVRFKEPKKKSPRIVMNKTAQNWSTKSLAPREERDKSAKLSADE